jgi:chaperonin GroEL
MAKAVAFDVEARQRLKRGIDIVAQSVRITLGPKGRNVLADLVHGVRDQIADGVAL